MQDEKSSLTLVFEAQFPKCWPLENVNRKCNVAILLKQYTYNFKTLFTDFGETGLFLWSFFILLTSGCCTLAFLVSTQRLFEAEKRFSHQDFWDEAFVCWGQKKNSVLWQKYLDVCILFLIWHRDIRVKRMWVNDVIHKRQKNYGKWSRLGQETEKVKTMMSLAPFWKALGAAAHKRQIMFIVVRDERRMRFVSVLWSVQPALFCLKKRKRYTSLT